MNDSVLHRLRERIKELSALHGTARLLQEVERPLDEVMHAVAALAPPAWQYPEITAVRIRCGDDCWTTAGFRETPWTQEERFDLRDGEAGALTIVYTEEREPADEGPFLAEERDLIRSLAELLRAFFQHRQDDAALRRANEELERQVAERTASLRRLSSEVCLVEERERRQIAEDLHDHLGQGLALMKLRLQRLRGDAIFGGHGGSLDDLISLSDQAIRYTRSLTFELSPPVLYELGLGPALDWLGEQTALKHGFRVKVRDRLRRRLPDDLNAILWRSARELLHNVEKHADARRVDIVLEADGDDIVLTVADDGRGFDRQAEGREAGDRFGLFAIEERLRHLAGGMTIDSVPGEGATVRLAIPRNEEPR